MIKVTILGNNSAIHAFNRNPTAQVIEIYDQIFLMDCGEGTQTRISKYKIHWGKINHIFISHLHGDHYFGLVGMISSMGLWNRTKKLSIYAPALLQKIILLQIEAVGGKLPFELEFKTIEPDFDGLLLDTPQYVVSCFPVTHGIPCHGFIFRKKSKGRKINAEACREYGIPFSYYPKLKEGANYQTKSGTIIENKLLTFDAPADKVYAFCADTCYEPKIIPFIKNADLIYHESTYLKNNEIRAAQRFHSTAEQAAMIAKQAEVGQLLLGHYSSRYENILPFETEAKSVFSNSIASIEGEIYTV